MWTVAFITFKEAYRRRILLLALLAGVVFLGLYGFAVRAIAAELHHEPFGISQMVFSQFFTMGLYFAGFIVSFLAIFIAVGTISGEWRTGQC